MDKLIGISGFARSGKDTLYNSCAKILQEKGKKTIRFAFADALKNECDNFLKKHVGISAFTEDNKEKEIIRPFLVTYGTDIRRKLDQNCWIKTIQGEVEDYLSKDYYVFITDVRFKNEAEWVNINGGSLVNLSREGFGPANHEERRQLHLMKTLFKYNLHWDTFGPDNISECDNYARSMLEHIFIPNAIFTHVQLDPAS
jgi:hypothetical protein